MLLDLKILINQLKHKFNYTSKSEIVNKDKNGEYKQ